VLSDARVLTNRRFVEDLDITRLNFDPGAIRENYQAAENSSEEYPWRLDSQVLQRLIDGQCSIEDEVEELVEVAGD